MKFFWMKFCFFTTTAYRSKKIFYVTVKTCQSDMNASIHFFTYFHLGYQYDNFFFLLVKLLFSIFLFEQFAREECGHGGGILEECGHGGGILASSMSVSGMLNMTPLPHAWMTSSGPPTPASSMRERYLMDTPKRRSSAASRVGLAGGRQGLTSWERSGSAAHDNDSLQLTREGEEEREEEERERRSWGDAATGGKNSTKEEKEKMKKREREGEGERKSSILTDWSSPLSPLGQERRKFKKILENAEKETLVLQVVRNFSLLWTILFLVLTDL